MTISGSCISDGMRRINTVGIKCSVLRVQEPDAWGKSVVQCCYTPVAYSFPDDKRSKQWFGLAGVLKDPLGFHLAPLDVGVLQGEK